MTHTHVDAKNSRLRKTLALPDLLWKKPKMAELRRWVAERLFEQELEEDFRMGIREGIDLNRRTTKASLQVIAGTTLKKNQPGVAFVLETLT